MAADLFGLEQQPKRTSPEQVAFLERIRAAGGVSFVARDLRDVLRELPANKLQIQNRTRP